jgi:hypothetical protein
MVRQLHRAKVLSRTFAFSSLIFGNIRTVLVRQWPGTSIPAWTKKPVSISR